jgi:hypothetical protein
MKQALHAPAELLSTVHLLRTDAQVSVMVGSVRMRLPVAAKSAQELARMLANCGQHNEREHAEVVPDVEILRGALRGGYDPLYVRQGMLVPRQNSFPHVFTVGTHALARLATSLHLNAAG